MDISLQNSNPVPTRRSVASYALIQPCNCPPDQPMWLVQWNAKWKKMNLISGHHEADDPNELGCILREVHEELFTPLDTADLEKMRNALRDKEDYDRNRDKNQWHDPWIRFAGQKYGKIRYTEFSESAGQWTAYEMTVFSVQLEPAQDNLLPMEQFIENPFLQNRNSPNANPQNEWIAPEDICKGFTKTGRAVSPTVKRILKECGISGID